MSNPRRDPKSIARVEFTMCLQKPFGMIVHILGMLPVNSFPASVLIDPRATHSFINTQFAAKHGILKLPMKKRMVVKSSGKEQISSYICPRVSIRIGEENFPENLIVMESTGIDIILGQNWSDRTNL